MNPDSLDALTGAYGEQFKFHDENLIMLGWYARRMIQALRGRLYGDEFTDRVKHYGGHDHKVIKYSDYQHVSLFPHLGHRDRLAVIYADGASTFYRVLGFLPPTAPVAMPVLYAAGDVPAWQAAVSAVLVAVGTVWMARTAATIYGRSILRTGSRVRLRQVLARG